jgi:hypothetical protein
MIDTTVLHAMVLETGLTAEKPTYPVIDTPVTGMQPRLIGLQVVIDTAVDQTVILQGAMTKLGPLRET